MTTTISHIGQEINHIISKSRSIKPNISDQEKINRFLDGINNLKKRLDNKTNNILKLDELFAQLTWLDLENDKEEVVMRDVINKSLSFHSKAIKNVVFLKKFCWKKNICRDEISAYKSALDSLEDSIYEVEEIFFKLRKDDEFNNLMNSL